MTPEHATGRFSLDPPIEPMLAKPIAGLPDSAEGLAFEPKWDGFRVLVYRRGEDVVIQGRMRAADAAATGAWDLTYAFPEMVERIRALRADDLVLDGELVVIQGERLAFDALQMRLRPRKEAGGWKIAQLATDYPTSFVAFDLVAQAGRDLRGETAQKRREVPSTTPSGAQAPTHSAWTPWVSVIQISEPATAQTPTRVRIDTARCTRGRRPSIRVSAAPNIGSSTGSGSRLFIRSPHPLRCR